MGLSMTYSDSKLEQRRQLLQSIHNLKMRFPVGIKSIDDEHDAKLKRLEELFARLYSNPSKSKLNTEA